MTVNTVNPDQTAHNKLQQAAKTSWVNIVAINSNNTHYCLPVL